MYTGKYNILLYIGTSSYRFNLSNVNFVYVNDLQDCLHKLSIFSYDAILINVEADNKAICEIVRIIRSMTYAPVIVIAKISTDLLKQSIYAGCDTVCSKDSSTEAIQLQVWALIRRYKQWNQRKQFNDKGTVLNKENLMMIRENYQAYWNNKKIFLTKLEYDFLYLLTSAPMRVYTYEQIYQIVWKDYPVGDIKNIIWCLVKRLRKKLNTIEDDAGNCIVSVREVGYKFELNNENEKQ